MNRAFEYAVGSNTIGHWLVALLLVGVAFAAFHLLRGFAATQFSGG